MLVQLNFSSRIFLGVAYVHYAAQTHYRIQALYSHKVVAKQDVLYGDFFVYDVRRFLVIIRKGEIRNKVTNSSHHIQRPK